MSDTQSKKHLFFSHSKSINYAFKKGGVASFRFGMFATSKEEEIEELTAEIKAGHPSFFIDPNKPYMTEEMEDPMKAMRTKIIAEHMASLAHSTNPENDMGKSDQGAFRAENTRDVASVAAGGDATQNAAKLVALAKIQASGAK